MSWMSGLLKNLTKINKIEENFAVDEEKCLPLRQPFWILVKSETHSMIIAWVWVFNSLSRVESTKIINGNEIIKDYTLPYEQKAANFEHGQHIRIRSLSGHGEKWNTCTLK